MVAPLLLAGLGAGSSLLGSLFGSSAQDEVNAARTRAINTERGRQKEFDAEAAKVNDQALGRYSNFDQQQAKKASDLAAMFKTAVVTPNTANTTAPIPAAASGIVQREIDNKRGIADAFVNHQADTLANYRSFGDLFSDLSRGTAGDALSVAQIGGFKRGSNAVLPLELDAANHVADGKAGLAELLTGIGKVGLTAAVGGQYVPAPGAPIDLTAPSVRFAGVPKFATPSEAMAVNPFSLY